MIFMRLMPIKKRKDYKNLKNNLKQKDKKNSIKSKFKFVKKEFKPSITSKENINN